MILYRPVKGLRNQDRRITQYYGDNFKRKGRRMYGEIVKGWKHHEGIDYAGPKPGDKVDIYSCTDGVVTYAGRSGHWGNLVIVTYGDYKVYYAHLHKIYVSVGQEVKANEKIALMGTTGNSGGVHLHLGLKKKDGRWIDPTPYIKNWETKKPQTPKNDEDAKKVSVAIASNSTMREKLDTMGQDIINIGGQIVEMKKELHDINTDLRS